MRLEQLAKYQDIMIQCHDNPDADAIGSGFALYSYFLSKGKSVRLFYSGRNKIQKTNLVLMLDKLNIPIEYIQEHEAIYPELLITVDCQYGSGNVTGFNAKNVAIIDHHQIENQHIPLRAINPNLGSCATLVWKMLLEAGYNVDDKVEVGTALYYGLYADTNQFSEVFNPLDMDMRDNVACNKSLITHFRNSNITLKELEIAGIAMIRYIYNDDYDYAIIKAQPCDPNILGLISDFLLQVEEIYTCVVYNEVNDGYKLSVRSCIKEVRASELAAFLTEGMGSGGGHVEKAGGFISKSNYEKEYPTLHSEAYFSERMNEYFEKTDIIYAKDYNIDVSEMEQYRKKKITLGYVKTEDVLPVGTAITVRTLEGDISITVEPDVYIMIGIKGEVYPISKEKFELSYQPVDDKFSVITEYIPTIREQRNGKIKNITEYASACIATGEVYIKARELDKMVKIFTQWDEEKYMSGRPGDYLAVRNDDLHDIYVVEKDIFHKIYELKKALD